MKRNTFQIFSTDFDSPGEGDPPHYRFGATEAVFPKGGIQVFIDGRLVMTWTDHTKNLWVHMNEGIIDAFVLKTKNSGSPKWD